MSSDHALGVEDSGLPSPDHNTDHDTVVADIAGHLNVQHSRLVHVMADALDNDAWVGNGIHTPTQWLAWKSGVSPERAAVIVKVAEQRAAFPHVFEMFARGAVSIEQVAVVVERAPAWADHKVVILIDELSVAQLRRTMTDKFFDDGPEPADPPAPPKPDRLSFGATQDDDRWRISGNFDITTGRRIEAALTQAKESLFERGDHDATWADALVEIAETSLDVVSSDARRDRYRTWLHFDVSNGSATTTDGWRIPMATRDHLLCDGVVQAVWERDGLPFSVGRSHRIVPDRTRRIIERRDRGCRVPGCTATAFVEIHHIIHWLNSGTSDTWNLLSLCGKHHRQHHRGELGIAGNADEEHAMTFTDINGQVLAGRGQPKLPETEAPPPTSGFTPPSGAKMNYQYFTGWVSDAELARRRTANRTRWP